MKIIKIICLFIFLAGCSTHNIKEIIKADESLKRAEKLIIAVRISEETVLEYNRFTDNMKLWFEGQSSDKSIIFIDEGEIFSRYKNSNTRFYQESAGKDFLKYKSLGLIKSFIAENRGAIQGAMRENSADAFMIYEVGGSFSRDMKVIRYDTLAVMINNENEIVYLDHQKQLINDGRFDRDYIDKEFFDTISRRLYSTLSGMGFVKQK